MYSHLLSPTKYHDKFVLVQKLNPYHDEEGQFTTKDKAHVASGPAQSLAAAFDPHVTPEGILRATVRDPSVRERFLEASKTATRLHDSGKSSKKNHTKPGTGTYSKERVALHNAIITKLLGQHQPNPDETPRVVMVGGRSGSGKSSFDSAVDPKMGVYSRDKFAVLDPDTIKGMLPDYEPVRSPFFHDESADIFTKAVAVARKAGLNVVLDFTMSNDKVGLAKSFKEKGYQVEAHYVHRPPEKAAESAIKRWLTPSKVTKLDGTVQTFDHGRIVPLEVVLKQKKNERLFDRLIKHVDAWSLYDNSRAEHDPRLVSSHGLTQKFNPYRDVLGRWTSKLKAVVGLGKTKQSQAVEKWTPGTVEEGRVLNGVPLRADSNPDFSKSVDSNIKEPDLAVPKGMKTSAGVVVVEPDGRMWIVQPKNRFGGYQNTFPKGTVNPGESLQETAAREVWEESGLVVKITGHLTDVQRTQSVARFYLGKRVGGAPWAHGPKETHAVKLIPIYDKGTDHQLKDVYGRHTSDQKVLSALRKRVLKYEHVLKRNPYHDEEGKFTSKERAVKPGWYKSHGGHHVEVGAGGTIASGTHAGKPAVGKHFAVGPFATHAEAKAYPFTKETAEAAKAFGIVKPIVPVKETYTPPPPPPQPVQSIAPAGLPAEVQNLHNAGYGVQTIAAALKITPDTVLGLLPSKPVATPQVVKNLSIANPNTFVGKEKLAQTQAHVVAQLKPKVGHAKVAGEEIEVLPSGRVLVKFHHQFYDKAKAAEALGVLQELYTAQGLTVVAGKPMLPGTVGVTLKGSRIYLESLHDPKADPYPPVVSEQAKQPPPTAPQPPKPLTAAQQTAKGKAQAAQLAKYTVQYEQQYVERIVESLNLKAIGQNSKAKAKLAPLTTIEKSLVQYGIEPSALKALQEKLQMQVEDKATAHFTKLLALSVESRRLNDAVQNSGDKYNYESPLYKSMQAARQALQTQKALNPGLLNKKGGNHTLTTQTSITVDYEKFKALQEVAKTKTEGPASTDHVIALDKAAFWGASKAEMSAATSQADLKAQLSQPVKTFSTVGEAINQLRLVGTDFHVNAPEVDWYASAETQALQHAKIATATAKYALAKAAYLQSGGTVAGLQSELNTISDTAKELKYAAAKAKKAAQNQMKETLQTASHDYMKAHFEYGATAPQTMQAHTTLQDLKKAAVPVLGNDSDVDAQILYGKSKWDVTIKQFKEVATTKVKGAIFAYEYAVLENAPPEKIAELKLQMEHAKKTDEKYFPSSEMDGFHAEQVNAAKGQVAIAKQMAKLGASLKTRLADMDSITESSEGGAWGYPSHGTAKSKAFYKTQEEQRKALTYGEAARLKAHTATAYKDINRAIGAYVKDGKLPDPDLQKRMLEFDNAMNKMKLGANVRLVRVMAQKYMAQAMGLGTSLDHLSEQKLQELVGRTYTEAAYSSTSMHESWSSSYSSAASTTGELKLLIRAGKDIHGARMGSEHSANPSEDETILARGTTYVIRSVKFSTGYNKKVIMEVDAVAQLPKPLPGQVIA